MNNASGKTGLANSGNAHTIKYRPEIDGLRAIAVLGVIVYHLNPNWLQGGFLGVDVFFVISGYLLTSIIHRQLAMGSFSFKKFWMRRIRRLFPALCCMVLFVLWVGYWLLIRPERIDVIPQTFAALFSYQNIWLLLTTDGYWDTSSDNIALLHTWSLSVEEQFYLFLPVLLTFLHQSKSRKFSLLTLLLLTAVTFFLCLFLTLSHRQLAFYLLPTRMWELLLGALLAMTTHASNHKTPSDTTAAMNMKWRHSLMMFAGIVLIIGSFYLIGFDESFPGYRPLYTCLGTMLILHFGQSAHLRFDPIYASLRSAPMRYLGRLSYSLYLWHWPLIVFARFEQKLAPLWLLLALIVLFSVLSYHLIETPFRRGFKRSDHYLFCMPLVIGLSMIPIWLTPASPLIPETFKGFDSPASLTRGFEYEAVQRLREGEAGVWIGPQKKPVDVCLIGSSHARVLSKPIADHMIEHQLSGVLMGTGGRGITQISPTPKKQLNDFRHSFFSALKPKLTIIAGKWSQEMTSRHFQDQFKKRVHTIAKHSNQVVILLQVPQVKLPEKYREAMRAYIIAEIRAGNTLKLIPNPKVDLANQRVRQITENLKSEEKFNHIQIVDPSPLFLNSKNELNISQEKQFLYSDFQHVNDMGAKLIFEHLLKVFLPSQGSAASSSFSGISDISH